MDYLQVENALGLMDCVHKCLLRGGKVLQKHMHVIARVY